MSKVVKACGPSSKKGGSQPLIERWRSIPGGSYLVSNFGRVAYSLSEYVLVSKGGRTLKSLSSDVIVCRTLNPWCKHGQYPEVSIHGEVKQVHQLVTSAFIGKRPKGYHTNHKDGVKHHNSVLNLHYVTPRENLLHAYKLGLKKPTTGPRN